MHNNVQAPHADSRPPSQTNERHYFVSHDPDSPSKLSTTVVHALADVMGADVTDAGFTLSDSVDPDALDRIFSPTADGTERQSGHLAFTVEGYRVTVYGDGEIVITPPQ
jgi:hypothetical protein